MLSSGVARSVARTISRFWSLESCWRTQFSEWRCHDFPRFRRGKGLLPHAARRGVSELVSSLLGVVMLIGWRGANFPPRRLGSPITMFDRPRLTPPTAEGHGSRTGIRWRACPFQCGNVNEGKRGSPRNRGHLADEDTPDLRASRKLLTDGLSDVVGSTADTVSRDRLSFSAIKAIWSPAWCSSRMR